MKTEKKYASVFELNGVPKLTQAFPLALQHVVAMIVGCVTPAIVIAEMAGLNEGDKVIFVQAALFIAAVSTLIQLFPLGGRIGSGLPVIMGVSFAYLPSMQAIVGNFDIATILGAQLIGGVVAIFVGIFVTKLRKLFPPLITGTVVFTIGLSLYPTAVKYMAGGQSSPNYGAWQNWLVAFLTLAVVVALNHFAKGILKLASILIGMIVGYIISGFFGMIDFSAVQGAGIFQIPRPMYFGMKFETSAVMTLVILFIINSVQAIGDLSATSGGGLDREPTDKELSGGIIGYGITNILGSFFGGLPTATFSQNVGIVATTKVVNRVVLGLAAGIILLAGFVPKSSALLTTIPQCVLGGATISVFASIAMTGIKLVVQQPLTYRNTSIVGLSVALGMGITQCSDALAQLPAWVTTVFGKSPVVVTTIAAILLNVILPKDKEAGK
ncbi:nucleobase:cation symporter-2 family protein [Faecalimonas umbilicata]|uniref:uracil-xanthine permease family protein n=1 Tax=Faecalimonas umbilicata TaxID=1912855 RepID=UPI0036F36676